MDRDIAIERRYELGECVSRGAFGEVVRGVERGTGEAVAIKRLHEHLVSAESTARVMREAAVLDAVRSPHVVRCFGWGRDEAGRPCLALEWLSGEDVARRRVGQSVTEGIEIARQVAEGLRAIHAAGFVHGDVKSSNVMVSQVGERLHVTVIDLGVARRIGEGDPALRGMIVGTPSYMSPEQARGDETIGPGSDLFSLGVLLYEMLTGRRPFTGSDPFVLLAKILLEDPPLLSTIAPHVPPSLDSLVMRALSKVPEQRFRTAGDLVEALAKIPVSYGSMAASVDETPTVQLTPELMRPSSPPPSGMSAMGEQRVVTAVFARVSAVPGAPSRAGAKRRKVGEVAEGEAGSSGGGALAVERAMAAFETVVTEHRGVAHRTIGGRMIAVFGAVRSSGDEADRAARAALSGLSRVPEVQVAITTGRAVASLAGLSGAAIERGASEVERAPRGAIRVDEATARIVGANFVVGGDENERVLLGERSVSAPAPLLLGREMPTVGRERELGALLELYRRCVDESASRAVQIVGPPGSGKSRLRFELLRRIGQPFGAPVSAASARAASVGAPPSHDASSHAAAGVSASGGAPTSHYTLLFGRAESLSVGSPFGLLRGALRRAAEIGATDGLSVQQKKMRALFARHLSGKALTRATLFLGELANVPFPDDASAELRSARNDPMLMGDRMRAAWSEWLFAACDEAPLVIVLEDLHWGDLPSAKFVELALLWLRDRPLFVLSMARPEIQEDFQGTWVHRPFDTIPLRPLAAEARAVLARAALPAGTPDDVVRMVVEKSEGNAFYLEELVRAVAAHGGGLREEQLPETVLGMVQARLDALGAGAKAVLRAASVFGNVFRPEGVRSLLGDMDPMRLAGLLMELAAEEAVMARSKEGAAAGVEYVFRNVLIRDAAYAMLTEDDRAAGHRLAAEYLTRAGDADAATLAGHCARARDTEGAARWFTRACERALEGNDFSAALEHAERAAQVTSDPDVLGPLRLLQAEAHRWRGELTRAEARGAEAAGLCEEGTALWFRAAAEIVAAAGRLGRYAEVALWSERAMATAARAGSAGAADAKVLFLSRAAVHLGYTHRADLEGKLLAEVDALLGDGGAAEPAAIEPRTAARVHQIRALFGLRAGDSARYVREHALALAAFEEAGDERSACLELVSLGSGYADLGAYAEAEAALERALAGAERMGLRHIAPWALQNLGHVRGRLGRKAEARVCLDRALEAGAAQRDARLQGGSRLYLSRLAHEEGRFEEAEREAREGAEVLAGVPGMRAGALAARARAFLGLGRFEEALAEARSAMGLLDELGVGKMGELEAFVRVALVEALAASGHLDEARAAASAASERLAVRASLIGDAGLRESFLARVPDHVRTRELASSL